VRFSIERTDALLDRVAPPVRESGSRTRSACSTSRSTRSAARSRPPRTGGRACATTATYQARERALRALKLADGARASTPTARARSSRAPTT
jgi:hypothetical protein